MTKLYEQLSLLKGHTFEVSVGEVTKTLTLGRFDFNVMMIYEEKGITVEKMGEQLQKNAAGFGSELAWELLLEKEEFNNDLEIFRSCLSLLSLESLADALVKTVDDSRPIVKNVKGVKTTKK